MNDDLTNPNFRHGRPQVEPVLASPYRERNEFPRGITKEEFGRAYGFGRGLPAPTNARVNRERLQVKLKRR